MLFALREEFKFFDQMEEIFRRELKADGSAGVPLVTEEADDSEQVLDQKKGETKQNDSL